MKLFVSFLSLWSLGYSRAIPPSESGLSIRNIVERGDNIAVPHRLDCVPSNIPELEEGHPESDGNRPVQMYTNRPSFVPLNQGWPWKRKLTFSGSELIESSQTRNDEGVQDEGRIVPTPDYNRALPLSGGRLPAREPFSGPEPPSCMNVTGKGTNPSPRLNAGAALEGVKIYCKSMVDRKVVLGDPMSGGEFVKPLIMRGQAEGGKDIVLSAMYDVTSCPSDHSMNQNDVAARGIDTCVEDFFDKIENDCSQTQTWSLYDPNFTLMGGAFANNCVMWSIYGQDPGRK